MALKKKSQVRVTEKRLSKDVDVEAAKKAASAKARRAKAQKKTTAENLAGKSKVKSAESKSKAKSTSDKKRKALAPDATEQGSAVEIRGAEQDPFEVAKRKMKGSVPAIVDAMVELAKQGSCSHAKTLLEMTGAKHMFDGDAERQDSGEPWAKLVLERLGEAEFGTEQETVSGFDESLRVAAE